MRPLLPLNTARDRGKEGEREGERERRREGGMNKRESNMESLYTEYTQSKELVFCLIQWLIG